MSNRSENLVMSTSFLKALPGLLDIKRPLPCILYILYEFSQGNAPASNDTDKLKVTLVSVEVNLIYVTVVSK